MLCRPARLRAQPWPHAVVAEWAVVVALLLELLPLGPEAPLPIVLAPLVAALAAPAQALEAAPKPPAQALAVAVAGWAAAVALPLGPCPLDPVAPNQAMAHHGAALGAPTWEVQVAPLTPALKKAAMPAPVQAAQH